MKKKFDDNITIEYVGMEKSIPSGYLVYSCDIWEKGIGEYFSYISSDHKLSQHKVLEKMYDKVKRC